jgi:hypothetical protein
MTTFILTWNPSRSNWIDRDQLAQDTVTAPVDSDWSTGNRTHGITPGDRAFMLKLGGDPRGIVASGRFTSDVYRAPHWDTSKNGEANYANVRWETVLDVDNPLSVADLLANVPELPWNRIQASGVTLPSTGDRALEQLWANHSGAVTLAAQAGSGPRRSGRQSDAVRRAAVEDHAQAVLEQHYRNDGWNVKDVRYGNPYDAIASKAGRTLYLEAKGTENTGASIEVEVTQGEVNHAKKHPQQCVMGIVSDIEFDRSGTVQPGSGRLHLYDWDPKAGTLTPTRYRWKP